MKQRGHSFKETLNSAIRSGLTQRRLGKQYFVQQTFARGAEQNFTWDKALAAADALEDEELTRKVSLAEMILIDANVLIYAVNSDAPLHRKAKAWLEATLSGPDAVGLSWSVLLAFLRLTSRPGVFQTPLSASTAFDVVDASPKHL